MHRDVNGEATLLGAPTGGHLEELERLRGHFVPAVGAFEWVTFDDAQSRSLLGEHSVHYVEYIPPRGYAAVARNLRSAQRILRAKRYSRIVSTGSGIAIPFLTIGRAMGIPCHYIESAARSQGPSFTGPCRPTSGRATAHAVPGLGQREVAYSGSLFDGFQGGVGPLQRWARHSVSSSRSAPCAPTASARRWNVSSPYFQRSSRPTPRFSGRWGHRRLRLGHPRRERVAALEMRAAIQEADLVIAHAGIGSALQFSMPAGARCSSPVGSGAVSTSTTTS